MTYHYPLGGETFSDCGYEVFETEGGWAWRWFEPAEEDEVGPWFLTRAEALRDVGRDWLHAGGGVPEEKSRFATLMYGLATEAEAGQWPC